MSVLDALDVFVKAVVVFAAVVWFVLFFRSLWREDQQ